ncbi:phosphoenolpyruvate carboxykinase (ATP) [Enterococcus sp. LJL128]
MSSINQLSITDIRKENPLFSKIRNTIETCFYGNNVTPVTTLNQAYTLAYHASGTIVTDLPVFQPESLELPSNCRVLVTNDGQVVGRTAIARRIIGQPGIDEDYYSAILREAVYTIGKKSCYHASAIVGLDSSFMIRSHLLLPEGFEGNLYSWLLNFQIANTQYKNKYADSTSYDEGDIYLLADPEWTHPDFPHGLVLFDSLHNTAAVLGLRYFGELKKAILTLAWGIAHRNGYIACHGGMKQYRLEENSYTMAAFGLSGSGKSTITLAKYNDQLPATVLHDDAFIISKTDGSSTALEPAYFDKTQDYPMADPAVSYFLTCQNIGVTLDDSGRKVLVTEDIRNGNGRTVKSRHATPNRKNHFTEKIDAVYWIMKDDSLPPILKINDPVLAALFGATLATKRSSAENLASGIDHEQLVIEPFANPFRCYPLAEDYQDFQQLFQLGTDCYILNTGYFNGNKVTPQQTLHCINQIVEKNAVFKPFLPLSDISYLPSEEHLPDFGSSDYLKKLKTRLCDRLSFIQSKELQSEGYDALPKEAAQRLEKLIISLSDFQAAL